MSDRLREPLRASQLTFAHSIDPRQKVRVLFAQRSSPVHFIRVKNTRHHPLLWHNARYRTTRVDSKNETPFRVIRETGGASSGELASNEYCRVTRRHLHAVENTHHPGRGWEDHITHSGAPEFECCTVCGAKGFEF